MTSQDGMLPMSLLQPGFATRLCERSERVGYAAGATGVPCHSEVREVSCASAILSCKVTLLNQRPRSNNWPDWINTWE